MGGQYKGNSGKLLVNGKNVQSPVKLLETGVYPGFPTDLQSPVMAVLSTIEGEKAAFVKWFLKTVIKQLTSCGKWEPGSAYREMRL